MADENDKEPQAADASSSEAEEEVSEEERARRERVQQRRERLRRLKERGELGAGAGAAQTGGGAAQDDGGDGAEKERRAAEKVGLKARERTGGSRKARMARQRAAAKDEPVADDADARTMTRRQVIRLSMWGTILLFFGANGLAFLNFFWPRRVGAFGGDVILGSLEGLLAELPVGGVRLYPAGRVFLVRLAEDAFMALFTTCPHLGCTVPWVDERDLFICPCHGSTYTPDGQIIHGPAPRPMDMMALRVEGGNLVVDTGDITQRPRHEDEHAFRVDLEA